MTRRWELAEQVIFSKKGVVSDHGGISVEKFLDNEEATGKVTAGFAIYEPGASTGDQPATHGGTEFLLLLEGNIIAEIGGQEYAMEPGNAIRFPGAKPHRGWNSGPSVARAFFLYY